MSKRSPLLHIAYLVAILIKGFDGALEALAGMIITLRHPETGRGGGAAARGGRLVFPVASLILAAFVIYMDTELARHWSRWVLSFLLFDLLTLLLVLNEWRNVSGNVMPRNRVAN